MSEGLPYLKVSAKQAVLAIEGCIVAGYEAKDLIREEYALIRDNHEEVMAKIKTWEQVRINWISSSLSKLESIFVSPRELYNFRDAQAGFGATSQNVKYIGIISDLSAKIEKLNEYDRYIRDEFNVKIEVIGGDKNVIEGDHGRIKTKR